jgi:DNA-binding protein H-NS
LQKNGGEYCSVAGFTAGQNNANHRHGFDIPTKSREKAKRMATLNVDKLPLKDLLDLQTRVERAITVAKDRERAEIKQKIASMVEHAGFSVGELFGARGRGKSVAAKYMNPDNRSETWTGRGRKPNWLVAKLGKGAKMDDFAV